MLFSSIALNKKITTRRRNPYHTKSVHILPNDETAIICLFPHRQSGA
jgi:hypothetical protein